VINADDFGLHPAVNDGVHRSHQQGVVTSTSLMACGSAFDDAIGRLRDCPELGVGVHLTLVEERPCLSPERISSLVGADGRMPKTYQHFARRWLTGRIRRRDAQRELEAQIQRVLDAGIRPTHLDSHQHVHVLPGVWALVVELAVQYRIPFLRIPRFDAMQDQARAASWSLLRAGVNLLGAVRCRRWPHPVRRADAVKGLNQSGRMTASALLDILECVEPGLTEIMVHPGTDNRELQRLYCSGPWRGFDWEGELAALLDWRVVERCRNGAFRLARFGNLAAEG
jgi:hopanoid biosynthesis associated protein HpnK